ncbi:hypothetical protein [Aeromicrobium sp.]|uniref:hypothetical protein n=1 Tax=Aeromicrobium sp. TaxID=1871063 RepID=UPI002FC59EC2
MNRTIRNLIVAAPLVLVGITVAPAAAMADGFDIGIPENKPEPHPGPGFDNDLPLADKPDTKDPKPQPKPQPKPNGPASVPQATDGTVEVEKKKAKKVVSAKGSPDSIDRSENLFVAGPAEVELAADTDNGGLDMTWLLVGGGVVTASGIAFAARKRTNA